MKNYRNPVPTVDVILQQESNILLIKRKNDPFKDHLSLPGGFVNEGELVEDAAKRETWEETSLTIEPIEILGVYSDPNRDPRGHVLTVVWVAIVVNGVARANDDSIEVQWVSLNDIDSTRLAFDHKQILLDYIQWRKAGRETFWSSKRRFP
jgi:ADP-ribose pyrophosphatase YjhB (NUDIX family)